MFYSSENELKSNQPAISNFYDNTLTKSYLNTPYGQLFYAYAIPKNPHIAIVISSGRIEGLEKYKELLWELYNNNYAVFIIDHQGQGRSYRHLKNKHKGYVKRFEDYAADLHLFNKEVVDNYWQGKKVLVSHSMGGAIAFDYLAHFEHAFSGAFLSAPMLDIYTKGTPKPLAKLVASTATLLGFQYSYALGQTDYTPDEFAINTLTSSPIRYELFRKAYKQEPKLQLGGVTYGWLHTTFAFISSVNKLTVNIPLYIASAQNDEIVDNSAQYKLANRHENTILESFADAKHELFFERDEIRQPLLKSLYQFCESVTI
ncbi:alpha/beta fold hydrolase [Pseudoalteromonas sp. BSi20495]|uniref:alpha/beta fold hydrolase n=1 Tax=Pseudoalteromonas sp. BSi20495 TaxID=386429 RepID=UPI0002315EF2|nr:alpha/beta fold hydrolase [Pseudoalteromonas sp. BSi20495]GAA80066.1 lysophospholipase [Pseudoalteromonas sp. BSi20495]